MDQLTVLSVVILAQLCANLLLVRWIVNGGVKSRMVEPKREPEKKPVQMFGGMPYSGAVRPERAVRS